MSLKLVYIAGVYGDKDGYLAIDRNIANAREQADWLLSHGIGFCCPHMNSAHFEVIRPEIPVEFWYEMDLRLMEPCDAMLIVMGTASERSAGTKRERATFAKTGKPVFDPNEHPNARAELLKWAQA